MRWLLPVAVLLSAVLFFFSNRPTTTPRDGGIERASTKGSMGDSASIELSEPGSGEGNVRAEVEGAPAERDSVAPLSAADGEELEPGGLRVRVIDERGQPVPGVDVELMGRIPGAASGGRWGKARSREPDGIARIDLADVAERLERLRPLGLAPTIEIQADIACSPTPSATIGTPLVDGLQVDLVLPPVGHVVVSVLDHEGQRLEDGVDVYFWWQPKEEAERTESGGGRRIGQHHAATRNGVARFERIGLGVVLSFTAWAEGLEGGSLNDVEGPLEAGSEKLVELRVGPPRPHVRFRVTDELGQPVAATQIEAQFVQLPDAEASRGRARPRVQVEHAATDTNGLAEFASNAHAWEVDRALDVVVRTPNISAHEDENWRVGTVPLPRSFEPSATIDLGEVRVGPVPIFAEGVVVDGAGAPLAGVDLRFQEVYGETWNDRKNLPDGRIASDANGRFILRGTRPPARLGVVAYLEGHEGGALTQLDVGDRTIVLELKEVVEKEPEPVGKIEVEIALPEGTPFLRLALYWKSGSDQGSSECPPAGVGPFELEDLAPGTYSVWVKSHDGHLKFGRVEGVEVVAGRVTRDVRLLPLDLTREIRTVNVQLVHPSGTPLHKVRPEIILEEIGQSFSIRTDEEGRAAFVVPGRTTRIGVSVDGKGRIDAALPADDSPVRVEIP